MALYAQQSYQLAIRHIKLQLTSVTASKMFPGDECMASGGVPHSLNTPLLQWTK